MCSAQERVLTETSRQSVRVPTCLSKEVDGTAGEGSMEQVGIVCLPKKRQVYGERTIVEALSIVWLQLLQGTRMVLL